MKLLHLQQNMNVIGLFIRKICPPNVGHNLIFLTVFLQLKSGTFQVSVLAPQILKKMHTGVWKLDLQPHGCESMFSRNLGVQNCPNYGGDGVRHNVWWLFLTFPDLYTSSGVTGWSSLQLFLHIKYICWSKENTEIPEPWKPLPGMEKPRNHH